MEPNETYEDGPGEESPANQDDYLDVDIPEDDGACEENSGQIVVIDIVTDLTGTRYEQPNTEDNEIDDHAE